MMEARVIKTFFPQLVTAISDCIHSVSDQCLAKGLVSDSTYRKILQSTGTNDDKARTLLSSILSITEGDHADSSTCFKQLLSILDESLPPGSKRILSAMKEELGQTVALSATEMSEASKRCVAQQETLSGRLEDSTRQHKVSKPLGNAVPKRMTLFEVSRQVIPVHIYYNYNGHVGQRAR